MRTSLVRLRARPALSLLPTTAGSTHQRRVSYKIEERGKEIQAKHGKAVHYVLRKVRFGSGDDGPEPPQSGREKARGQRREQKTQEGQEDAKHSLKRQQAIFRKTSVPGTWEAPVPDPFRSVQLERVRRQESTNPFSRRVVPEQSLVDAIDGTAGDRQDEQQHIKEVDKWGKSVDIWLSLLQREARLKGPTGIGQVWTLIKEAEVDLPVKSSKAGQFWRLLLSNSKLHDDVLAYAIRLRERTGKAFAPLYTMLVTYYIRESTPTKTLRWHRRILDNYTIPQDALKALAIPASTSPENRGLEAFRIIYEDLYPMCSPCYDHLIPALLNAGKSREALRWHNVLSKNNDCPSPEVANTELVQTFQRVRHHVTERTGARWRRMRAKLLGRAVTRRGLLKAEDNVPTPTEPVQETEAATTTYMPFEPVAPDGGFFTAPTAAPTESSALIHGIAVPASLPSASKRGLISTLFTEMQNAGPDGFSDEFCARLYATRALTPSWVSSFIHAFSVKKIGPLALRELALRARSTEDIQYYIADLKTKGISIGSSKFSRIVKHLAELGDAALLGQILHGDQHPDTLDDDWLQVKILDEAMIRGDSTAVHRTLTLLSMFTQDPKQEYMNMLLSSHVRNRRIPDILRLADAMETQGVKLTVATVELAARRLLRPRSFGKRPDVFTKGFEYDDLRIVTNIVLRALEAGTETPEWIWVELFKRHGMKNLASMERFCHATITSFQSIKTMVRYNERARITGSISLVLPSQQPPNELALRASFPVTNLANPLHTLLSARRLQNIVSWGFHDGLRRLSVICDRHYRLRLRRQPGKRHSTRYRRWPSELAAPSPSQTFLCGISILQGLQEKGTNISVSATEEVLRQRIWTLYGPGRSRKRRNATATALNPYGIVEILRTADAMWNGPPLFKNVKDLLMPLKPDEVYASVAYQACPEDEPFSNNEETSHGFGAELPSDDIFSEFRPIQAREILYDPDQLDNVISGKISDFIAHNTEPTRDPVELQIRRYTQALMRIFWSRRTVGTGTAMEMREQRAVLTQEQWTRLLYAWARQMARRDLKS